MSAIDPLDIVFETPEEQLANFLRTMPKSLIPVFEREFIRPAELAALRAELEEGKRLAHKVFVEHGSNLSVEDLEKWSKP